MKIIRLIILITLIGQITKSEAQLDNYFHEGKFKKFSGIMGSNHYKTDNWESALFDKAIKAAFPSDINKTPDQYKGKLIHLIGIIDDISVEQKNESTVFTFTLENKYWDYIEDYSIQDEVMFISPKGDGKFAVIVMTTNISPIEIETITKFKDDKKLFLIYADFKEIINGIPVLVSQQIKYIDYKFYTTKICTYDIERDDQGKVVTNKDGTPKTANFDFLKVAGPGQNK